MVVFAVHTNKWGFQIGAELLEDDSQSFDSITIKNLSSIFGDKDQMDVQLKDAMSAVSNVT